MISSLLDATLHSIDDVVLSSSNWVLELLEATQDLETAIEEQITQEDISHFTRENRPMLHSSVEKQYYKPVYLLRRGEFRQHL